MSTELTRSSALDEEVARAEMYGLLATLFYQPPSAELLAQLQTAVIVVLGIRIFSNVSAIRRFIFHG